MALTKITSEIIESNLTLTGTADGSTTPLTLKNTSTNAASEARIEFNQGGTSHGYITSSYNSNSPFMAFSVGSGSAEKVRITSAGRVGINTSSPTKGSLVVSGAAYDAGILIERTDTSSRWGLAGTTSGAFQIWDDNQGDSTRLVINSSGNVGMGSTGDTTHRLTVAAEQTSGKRCMLIHSINSGLACVVKNTSGTGAYDPFAFLIDGGNTQVGGIASGAGGTSFNTSSDYRLKENVDYTWDATTRLKQLRPARFNWISDDTDTLVDGFLAHEVEDIVPEAITGTKDATKTHTNVVREAGGYILEEGVTEDDWIQGKEDGIYESDTTWTASLTKDVYQQIDQAKLVPLLVKTIQELEARITTLENA
jgi:hypothetical protein